MKTSLIWVFILSKMRNINKLFILLGAPARHFGISSKHYMLRLGYNPSNTLSLLSVLKVGKSATTLYKTPLASPISQGNCPGDESLFVFKQGAGGRGDSIKYFHSILRPGAPQTHARGGTMVVGRGSPRRQHQSTPSPGPGATPIL